MQNKQKQLMRELLQATNDPDLRMVTSFHINALKAAIDAMPDELPDPEPQARAITCKGMELEYSGAYFGNQNDDYVIARVLDEVPDWVHEKMGEALWGDTNGKSEQKLVRLANGDLIYGEFPQGDTYEQISQGMKGAI